MLRFRKHRISRLEEDKLIRPLQGIPASACCFALLVWIWHEPDSFFERYPLQDAVTVLLNSLLLFTVLPLMAEAFGLQAR